MFIQFAENVGGRDNNIFVVGEKSQVVDVCDVREIIDIDNTLHVQNTIAEKQRRYRSIPQTNLGLEHTQSCRIVPTREVLLKFLPKKKIVAEIGVQFGDFAEKIYKINQPKELHLIDTWNTGMNLVENTFKNVHLHKGSSVNVLATFPIFF